MSNETSSSLAAIVFAYRTLGICKNEAREAMAELAKRKDNGDDFDVEGYIKQKSDELPKPQLHPTLINALSTISSIGAFTK